MKHIKPMTAASSLEQGISDIVRGVEQIKGKDTCDGIEIGDTCIEL